MPRFTAASTVSANLPVANSFTSFSASSTGYCLPGVSFAFQAFTRFATAMVRLPPHRRPCCARCPRDRKSTRLNSSHSQISYAVFCLKKKKNPSYTQILVVRLYYPQKLHILSYIVVYCESPTCTLHITTTLLA